MHEHIHIYHQGLVDEWEQHLLNAAGMAMYAKSMCMAILKYSSQHFIFICDGLFIYFATRCAMAFFIDFAAYYIMDLY